MKNVALGLLLVLTITSACKKEKEDTSKNNNDLIISYGTICGWCALDDSMSITGSNVYYRYNTQCNEIDYIKNSPTLKSDWDELIKLLNYEEFKKINVNSCDVCFDGCDTWISIKKDSITHKIRFGYGDSLKIENIKPFIHKLDSLRVKMRN